MILRRLPTETSPQHHPANPDPEQPDGDQTWRDRLVHSVRFSLRGISLKSRLAALVALVVMASIIVITPAAYFTVRQVLSQEMDKNLQTQAQGYIDSGFEFPVEQTGTGENYRPRFFDAANNMSVLIISSRETGPKSDTSRFEGVLGAPEIAVVLGDEPYTFRTEGNNRIFAVSAFDGRVVVVKQDITFTNQTLDSLGLVLILISITGFLGAIVAGIAVATSGLQPINRLRRATDHVTATGELRQIAVYTTDELGALTRSFNNMMSALQDAQTKQKNLVADASHELKTPLTSLRTNVELLMLASKTKGENGAPGGITEQDRQDIEKDVIAQIEEMSSLIGDLVDLAREDASEAEYVPVELRGIIEEGVERVQRRRPDVHFDVHLLEWEVVGDEFSLSRAMLNLLDNAAKWSPEGGHVRVWMEPVIDADYPNATVEIRVADSGPGIPAEDRAKVFDRFYRSINSRSMPGSGLGLAIVKQVVEKHGGVIIADESDDKGALMRVLLPGRPEG